MSRLIVFAMSSLAFAAATMARADGAAQASLDSGVEDVVVVAVQKRDPSVRPILQSVPVHDRDASVSGEGGKPDVVRQIARDGAASDSESRAN